MYVLFIKHTYTQINSNSIKYTQTLCENIVWSSTHKRNAIRNMCVSDMSKNILIRQKGMIYIQHTKLRPDVLKMGFVLFVGRSQLQTKYRNMIEHIAHHDMALCRRIRVQRIKVWWICVCVCVILLVYL